MITREQAEQAFHERYDQPHSTAKPEIRAIHMEAIDLDTLICEPEFEDIGPFDLETQGWKCTFEVRYRELSLGEWTGDYTEWRKETCYIVEPKSGPYVID